MEVKFRVPKQIPEKGSEVVKGFIKKFGQRYNLRQGFVFVHIRAMQYVQHNTYVLCYNIYSKVQLSCFYRLISLQLSMSL